MLYNGLSLYYFLMNCRTHLPVQGLEPWISRLEALRVIQLRYTGVYSPQLDLNQRPKDIILNYSLPLYHWAMGRWDTPLTPRAADAFGDIYASAFWGVQGGIAPFWDLWGSNPRANKALGLKSNSLTTRTKSPLLYLPCFACTLLCFACPVLLRLPCAALLVPCVCAYTSLFYVLVLCCACPRHLLSSAVLCLSSSFALLVFEIICHTASLVLCAMCFASLMCLYYTNCQLYCYMSALLLCS